MRLTLPQQDIYYEQLLYPNEPIYNIGAKISIRGGIIYEVLNQAYIALIDQHDAYRSVVIQREEGVEIEILPDHRSILGFVDLSGEEDPDDEANRYMQALFTQTFHFNDRQLLHRFMLIKVSDTFYYIFSMYHHLITDGWGTSLMFQRWVKNYNELITAGKIESRYLYTYNDFVADDAQYADSAEFDEDMQYWRNKFQYLPERLFQKINDNVYVNKSHRRELIVPRPLYNQLEVLATSLRCSTFHVILAVVYMYLGRRYQQNDVAIGLPVLNRGKSAFKKTVGLFMGISPLRMKFSFENTFEELVYNIKQQLRQDYRHQRLPLGRLIQELDAFMDKDRLFNITLSYQKQNFADQFINTETKVIPLSHDAERVALAIYIREFDIAEDVKMDFDYHINYFDESTISGIVTHFEQLLQEVCIHPGMKLKDFKYLTLAEEEQLVYTFNQTKSEYPDNVTLLPFFRRQAKDKAEFTAVWDDTITYTYQELEVLSDHIAMHLSGVPEVKRKEPIAVLMPRSANLVATLLGILKAGNAYIPLDPDFPQERLEYITAHSEVTCIIGTGDHRNSIRSKIPFICIDDIIANRQKPLITLLPDVRWSDTAYIIYTSGSTGVPKGVEVGHGSLLNFLLSIQQCPGLKQEDIFFSVTTQSFDISILEFFAPLISGAKLYIASKELQSDPVAMIAKLEEICPSMIQATPSFYQLLYNGGWKGNKGMKVLCGGDLLSTSLAEKLLDTQGGLWNMYGPTETTIWSGIKQIGMPADASNIGSPIHNTQFYILDEYLQLLPVGCPGVIYIGGAGLAKGYYKNEALTAGCFITNPFNTKEKIYKTGDLGQWNAKGEIRFLGRNDQQVKIRGYRIELGEVETKLNQLTYVKSSVVIAKRKKSQEAFLVAYVILTTDTVDTAILISALQKELPEYMIPYIIVPVQDFPLTPNNKIDRKLLVSREVSQLVEVSVYVDPETFLEEELCHLFKESLEWDGKVGITDNFFSLGGHSLNAMRVVNRIQKQLHYNVSLKSIFDHPTVQSLANYLQERGPVLPPHIEVITTKPYYPVSPAQYALWLATQQGYQRSAAYNVFVVYTINGTLDFLRLEQCFIALIKKYEILRTNFIVVQGIPYQKVTSDSSIRFQLDNIAIAGSGTLEAYVNKAFDLENDLLLRVGIFKRGNECFLAFSSHHIILDGWSMGELIHEIIHYYNTPSLQDEILPFQFRDYVSWLQQTTLKRKNQNERYWEDYLRNYRWKTIIPAISNKAADEYLSSEYSFQWEKNFFIALKETARKQNSTLHTLLLTAFLTLLYKIYDYEDLCIGTVNSGRTIADLHNQVGMFVKTLPLRAKFRTLQTFSAQIKAIHNSLLEMDANQDLPENINNRIWLDILFVLQPPAFSYDNIQVGEGVDLILYPVSSIYSRLPILINFIEGKESLRCVVNYSTDKYDKATIELLFLRYKQLLDQIIEKVDLEIEQIDIELAFEKEQAIDIDFNF